MSVGWGRSTWGTGPWGQPASVSVSVNVSGVAGTSALGSITTDAEANVIKNLMDRIDQLENQILKLQKTLECLVNSESIDITKVGDAQNIKDKEIIDFLGDN